MNLLARLLMVLLPAPIWAADPNDCASKFITSKLRSILGDDDTYPGPRQPPKPPESNDQLIQDSINRALGSDSVILLPAARNHPAADFLRSALDQTRLPDLERSLPKAPPKDPHATELFTYPPTPQSQQNLRYRLTSLRSQLITRSLKVDREPLAKGSQGFIYRVTEEKNSKGLLLKVASDPTPGTEIDPHAQLKHETFITQMLPQHPSLVRARPETLDGGLLLEEVPGQSLGSYLKSRTIADTGPTKDDYRIMKQIAQGLTAIHEKHIIHRDLSPNNIILNNQNAVIIDFGLAIHAPPNGPRVLPPLPNPDTIAGTPRFMSPEHIVPSTLSTASDIRSAGLIFYELLTGRSALDVSQGARQLAFTQAMATPPPVRSLNPKIPKDVADLVMRMIDTKPENRPTAREVNRILARHFPWDPTGSARPW